jgi:hypothetical protein
MKLPSVKEVVSGTTAEFDYYMDGNLWYRVGDFKFPIPMDETRGGCFNRDIKAITLMRWIRKHLEELKAAKLSSNPDVAAAGAGQEEETTRTRTTKLEVKEITGG